MWTCFLCCSLFVLVQAIADESSKVEEDLKAIKDLQLDEKSKNISNFTPDKTSINLNELEKLDEKLNSSKSRDKRQYPVDNLSFMNLNDEVRVSDPNSLNDAKAQFESTMQTLQMPNSKGNPSFSIHASTVYILYPSIFQDPNVFGRISIPQNINTDKGSSTTKKGNEQTQNLKPMIMPQRRRSNYLDEFDMFRSRRNANPQDMSTALPNNDAQPRNIENHATGTIVVLNQDVIEQNKMKSY